MEYHYELFGRSLRDVLENDLLKLRYEQEAFDHDAVNGIHIDKARYAKVNNEIIYLEALLKDID